MPSSCTIIAADIIIYNNSYICVTHPVDMSTRNQWKFTPLHRRKPNLPNNHNGQWHRARIVGTRKVYTDKLISQRSHTSN